MAESSQVDTDIQTDPSSASGPIVAAEMRTLGLHSAHYLAGFLGSMAFGLVSFPIFTRVFSVAEYGIIDLAQKVVLIFTAGSKMGLQNAALRFYDSSQLAHDSNKARTYYSTMCFGVVITSSMVVLLFLALMGLFPRSWISSPLAGLSSLLSILILLRALESILCAFLRVEERTKAFNIIAVAIKALTIAAVCTLLPWAGRTASTYFAGTTAVEMTTVLVLVVWLIRRRLLAVGSFDSALFRVGVAFGLPLVLYESAFTVLGSADRFLVLHYLGKNALGHYSVAYGLSQTVNDVLLTPLNLALMPIYMRLWTLSGREATIGFLTTALDYYVIAAAGVLSISAACARDVVVLLSSSKYAGADRLIPMLLAGLLIYTTHLFVAAGLLLHKQTLRMAGILFFCAVVNIVLNCLLLPWIGLPGSALATLLSYLLCILVLWRASSRVLPLRINVPAIGRCAVAAMIAWLAASAVSLKPPILSVAASSTIALSVYLGTLLAIDSHLRSQAAQLSRCAARVYRHRFTGGKQR